MKTIELDLNQFRYVDEIGVRARSISGRKTGAEAYAKLDMGEIVPALMVETILPSAFKEEDRKLYKIILDKEVLSISGGFFLEVFANAIKILGEDNFLERFDFSETNAAIQREVLRGIRYVLDASITMVPAEKESPGNKVQTIAVEMPQGESKMQGPTRFDRAVQEFIQDKEIVSVNYAVKPSGRYGESEIHSALIIYK